MTKEKTILITGGAGFIGSHAVRYFVNTYPLYAILNLDALTYAGNLENLRDIESSENYEFIHGDINDGALMVEIIEGRGVTDVIHLAAESHVDRSISDPLAFLRTNIFGTVNLLEACRAEWGGNYDDHLFYHISTDEVFGSLGDRGFFTETTPYEPQSPYSASKASSDHFVRAYANTYGMRVVLSNCSNNYGPYQFPEKLIPLIINNIKHQNPLPVYGDGKNIRDWLYVVDHVTAMDRIFHEGLAGESYNIGGNNEMENIQIVHHLCDLVDGRLGRAVGSARELITYVKDRPGHDRRYAIDSSKIMNELDWTPSLQLEEGLAKTVDWYLANETWLEHVTSGEYRSYYLKQYAS